MTTSFLQAVKDCRYIHAKLLLERGVSIDCQNANGLTPLVIALRIPDDRRRARMFKWLLRMGADVSCIDTKVHRDLLTWAVYYNRTDEVKCILDQDEGIINFQHQDKYGRTAMHYAAIHNNIDCLQWLVNLSVKYELAVDIRDNEGLTPYLVACIMEHDQSKDILVGTGHAITSQLFLTSVDPISLQKAVPLVSKPKSRKPTQLPPIVIPLRKPRSDTSSSKCSSKNSLESVGSSPWVFLGAKPRTSSQELCIPKFLDILSQQSTQTYRPCAVFPTMENTTPAPSEETSLSFGGAARIGTLAANLRKKSKIPEEKRSLSIGGIARISMLAVHTRKKTKKKAKAIMSTTIHLDLMH